MRQTALPSYRLHKPTGRAVVTLNGRDLYLGEHGTPESRQRYLRLLAEWEAAGRAPTPPARSRATACVSEVVLHFWRHAKSTYHGRDGAPTSSLDGVRQALRPVRALYGRAAVSEFGPLALQAVRHDMIRRGLSRTTVNKYTGLIKFAFRWAAAQELVPIEVYQRLATVPGLRAGQHGVREGRVVRPAPEAHVAAVQPYVSRQVWALIRMQELTGARPGEVVGLRAVDLDTSAAVWTATLAEHKTAYRGESRTLYFGPQAQAVLRPFLEAGRPLDAPLFSAAEADAEVRRRPRPGMKGRRRASPARPEQKRPGNRSGRVVGEAYTVASYRRAIARACDAAGVPRWSPHQLRHLAATRIRKAFGIEAAQIVLGHANPDVTLVYAERDQAAAQRVIAELG